MFIPTPILYHIDEFDNSIFK